MKRPKVMELQHPEKVSISDCILAAQMGFYAILHNGQFIKFKRRKYSR